MREENVVMRRSPGHGDVCLYLSCMILHIQNVTPYETLRYIPYLPLHQPPIRVSLRCEVWQVQPPCIF